MTYQTNPVILRVGITQGWYQSYFAQNKISYTDNFTLWLKLYIYIKGYLKRCKILLVNYEFKSNNQGIVLLYLNVQKQYPPKRNVKWRTKKRSARLRGNKVIARAAYLLSEYNQFFKEESTAENLLWKLTEKQLELFSYTLLYHFKKKVGSLNKSVFTVKQMHNAWYSQNTRKLYLQFLTTRNWKRQTRTPKLSTVNKKLKSPKLQSETLKTFSFKYKKHFSFSGLYLRRLVKLKVIKLARKQKFKIRKKWPFIRSLISPLNRKLRYKIFYFLRRWKKRAKKEKFLPKHLVFRKKITKKHKRRQIIQHKIPLWGRYFLIENYYHKFFKICFNLNIVVKFQQILERLVSTRQLLKKFLRQNLGQLRRFRTIRRFNAILRSMFTYYKYGNLLLIGENIATLLERNKKKHTFPLRAMKNIIHLLRPLFIRGFKIEVFGKVNARTRARSFKAKLNNVPLHRYDARVDAITNYASAKTGSFGIKFTSFMDISKAKD